MRADNRRRTTAPGGFGVVVLVLASITALASCSGSVTRATSSVSATPKGQIVGNGLSGIPQYPNGRSFGPPTVKDNVTAESFHVDHATPSQIVGWYAENLRGWTQVRQPAREATGASDVSAEWNSGDRWLSVSARAHAGCGWHPVQPARHHGRQVTSLMPEWSTG